MILDALISSACTIFTAFLLAKFVKYVVLFSKIFIAAVAAIVLCQFYTPVPNSTFLSFLLICGVLLVILYLLSKLPRFHFSLTYATNMVLITIVGTIASQTILPKIGSGLEMNKYIMLLIYAVCAVISFRVLMDQVKIEKDFKFLPLRALDRLLGAMVNTVTLFYCILQTVNFPDNIPLLIAVAVITVVLFYIADIFLFKHISGMATGRKPTSEMRYLKEIDWSKPKAKLMEYDEKEEMRQERERSRQMRQEAREWAWIKQEEDRKRQEQALEDSYWAAQEAMQSDPYNNNY